MQATRRATRVKVVWCAIWIVRYFSFYIFSLRIYYVCRAMNIALEFWNKVSVAQFQFDSHRGEAISKILCIPKMLLGDFCVLIHGTDTRSFVWMENAFHFFLFGSVKKQYQKVKRKWLRARCHTIYCLSSHGTWKNKIHFADDRIAHPEFLMRGHHGQT